MKKMTILATIVALSMAFTMPVSAQSKKDKKAAEKAAWEMEQQQKAEEAALLHQIKMDSIRNAQKMREDAAAKAKADLEKAEARLAEEERQAAEAAKHKRKVVKLPCKEAQYKSDEISLRGFASREGLDTDAAQQAAMLSAKKNLADMIEASIQALASDYLNEKGKNKSIEQERKLEQMTQSSINRTISMAPVICEEYEAYTNDDGMEVYVCYIVVEINREDAIKPIYDGLSKEADEMIDKDYDKYKEEFKQHFDKEEQAADAAIE